MGLVDGRLRHCRARWTSRRSFELWIEGVGSFTGRRGAAETSLLGPEPGAQERSLEAAFLGPPLLLTLALHGVFCLHTSAVFRNDEMVLFLGESGAGKSTLAASFARRGWRRLADDLLPFRQTPHGDLEALVDFPQLKVSATPPRPAGVAAGERPFALRRAYVLKPEGRAGGDLRTMQLPPAAALSALLLATVPWSLLSFELSRVWFSTLCEVVQQPEVLVSRWIYPHRPDCLDQAYLEAS
ncbi:MAG: hypothetical protein AAF481_11795 [Acidobacteriota bacterium]